MGTQGSINPSVADSHRNARGQTPAQAALANRGAAPLQVYGPAKDTRQNVFKNAAAATPVALYGVTAANALAAPGELSFGQFIRRPETLELFGSLKGSNATRLLQEFQQAFPDTATRKQLAQFVRTHYSGKPRGFRYWDRLAGSIWKMYRGVLRAKERTGKAHDGEVKRLKSAARRAGREAERSTLRRVPKTQPDKRAQAAAKLRRRAMWLHSRADKKFEEARLLAERANVLKAEAHVLEAEATRIAAETTSGS